MLFDHNKKVVFRHVPKCGGTYLTYVLQKYYGFEKLTGNTLSKYTVVDKTEEITRMIRIPGALEHFPFSMLKKEIRDNYILLISVRHPIYLWISNFFETKYPDKVTIEHPVQKEEHDSFLDFIKSRTKNLDKEWSFSYWVEKDIRSARKCHIIRQESLTYDFLRCMEKLGYDNKTKDELHDIVLRSIRRSHSSKEVLVYNIISDELDTCKMLEQYEHYLLSFYQD